MNSRVVQALCPNRHSLDLEVGEVSGDMVMIKSSLVLHAGQLALLPKCFIDWFFFLICGCGSLLAFCNEGERKEPFFSPYFWSYLSHRLMFIPFPFHIPAHVDFQGIIDWVGWKGL